MRPAALAPFRIVLCSALLLASGDVTPTPPAGQVAGSGDAASPASSDLVVTEPPVKLKWKRKTLGKGSYSSIAVDSAANPHVVFLRETKGDYILTHAWAEGSHWFSEPVAEEVHVSYDNAVAIDGDDGLHVAYAIEEIGVGHKLKYAHRTGGGWQAEVIDDGGLSNSIAVDEDGFAHVVHIDGSFAETGVHYARQTETGWELESVSPSGSWFGGSSLLLRDDKVYVTFQSAALPSYFTLAIREAGIWTTEEISEGGAGSAAFDAAGMLHVVYSDGSSNLTHAWLTETGWENETLITGSEIFGETLPPNFHAIAESPALVADSAGRLQLANGLYLSKGQAWTEALLASSFDGVAWSPSLVGANRIGFLNSIAVDSNDIVHVATYKAGSQAARVVAVRLKGAKLSLAVVPKESGTISAEPSGLQCTSKASERLYPGTQVTLTAVPAEGFMFTKWSGAASGTEPEAVVTVDKARKVVAHFEALR